MAMNLGFLTIVQENGGYLGGYLVTNLWGRPLEFRLSNAVRPNRLQQILYAGTLQPFLCADLIGKSLVAKTATQARCILTDCEAALDLRLHIDVPVAWLAANNDPVAEDLAEEGAGSKSSRNDGLVIHHPRFPADGPAIQELLERVDTGVHLTEPFARIRQALAEAHKVGVTARA
jgi:hypothetical protein